MSHVCVHVITFMLVVIKIFDYTKPRKKLFGHQSISERLSFSPTPTADSLVMVCKISVHIIIQVNIYTHMQTNLQHTRTNAHATHLRTRTYAHTHICTVETCTKHIHIHTCTTNTKYIGIIASKHNYYWQLAERIAKSKRTTSLSSCTSWGTVCILILLTSLALLFPVFFSLSFSRLFCHFFSLHDCFELSWIAPCFTLFFVAKVL